MHLVLLAGCEQPTRQKPTTDIAPPARKVTVIEREGRLEYFPCSKCHDKVDAALMSPVGARKHREITAGHYEDATRCRTCHDPANMDALTLLSTELVSFDASYKVCGQCHGEKIRDWRIGAHGKTVGGWMGEAQKMSCTHCHDAHAPGMATVMALPPPPFPVGGIRKGDHR
jgi:uncharacterized CHY-type Zn-finger protein